LSDPVTLSRGEADALAVLAPHVLPGLFGSAVTLVEATGAGLDSRGETSRQVSEELTEAQSVEVGRFFTHLMNNTTEPFWGSYDLKPKLKLIVARPGDWTALREAALRLGIDLSD
jgi:hypothetical protein